MGIPPKNSEAASIITVFIRVFHLGEKEVSRPACCHPSCLETKNAPSSAARTNRTRPASRQRQLPAGVNRISSTVKISGKRCSRETLQEKQERRSHADQLLGLLAVGVQNAEQKILKGCKKQGKGKQNHIQGGGKQSAVSPLNSPPSPAAGRDRMRNSSRNRQDAAAAAKSIRIFSFISCTPLHFEMLLSDFPVRQKPGRWCRQPVPPAGFRPHLRT